MHGRAWMCTLDVLEVKQVEKVGQVQPLVAGSEALEAKTMCAKNLRRGPPERDP